MHKIDYKKLCKNDVGFRRFVEKNRNIEHFFGLSRKKIVKSVHNSSLKCYN